jgi:hypothetical protein
MKLFNLKNDEQYLQDYLDRKIEEVNSSILDNKTKQMWRLELEYVRDLLKLVRKYKAEVDKL